MKLGDIRSRMLLAALLPVALQATLLAAMFLLVHVSGMQSARSVHISSVTRTLATASEYGLYSGDAAYLQKLADGTLRESDVRSVAIVDARGSVLARVGSAIDHSLAPWSGQNSEVYDPRTRTDRLSHAVLAGPAKLDDVYENQSSPSVAPQLLGHVVMEFSREALLQQKREIALLALAVTVGGLLFAGVLALYLGRGVLQPILRISDTVERIGRGELSARLAVLPKGPLDDLQRGLNLMAQRLELGRDELEQRVEAATRQLREKKEQAEAATLAKSRFVAVASHDLRQPVHALGMFVNRLAQLPHDSQTRHLVEQLESAVRSIAGLLDGLLDISRLDAQAVRVQVRPFPLADLFEQVRAGWTHTALQQGLRLRVRPTQVWLLSDPGLLYRILLNLVDNALRYTEHGGVLVTCRLAADGKQAHIEIWDSGIGIAAQHQEAVFQEFYQVANVERNRGKGLGLGLNSVARHAQLLAHRLQMRSALGRGTRFRIEVPVAAAGAARDARGSLRDDAFGNLAGLIVLLIEDDALASDAVASLLASWGCVVLVADGVAAALAQLDHRSPPDVIVSDYRLRDGDSGIDAIGQLRAAADREIPACLISGDTDPALMALTEQAGLTLLHKPVPPAKLRNLVRRLVSADHDAAAARL